MATEKGFSFYGQYVGVLIYRGKSPRVPGDPGHGATFPFPVCYEVVEGSFTDMIKGSDRIKDKLCAAVRNLESKGVRAVIGDCGLMALYQRELASCSSLPVLTSSLVLVPLIWNLIGQTGAVGIITGHAGLLHKHHLRGAGIHDDINLQIQGMEEEPHFKKIVIDGAADLDVTLMERDVLSAAKKLLRKNKEVRVLVLECSNLPSYGRALQETYHLPVFDVTAAALMLAHAVHGPCYV